MRAHSASCNFRGVYASPAKRIVTVTRPRLENRASTRGLEMKKNRTRLHGRNEKERAEMKKNAAKY